MRRVKNFFFAAVANYNYRMAKKLFQKTAEI